MSFMSCVEYKNKQLGDGFDFDFGVQIILPPPHSLFFTQLLHCNTRVHKKKCFDMFEIK